MTGVMGKNKERLGDESYAEKWFAILKRVLPSNICVYVRLLFIWQNIIQRLGFFYWLGESQYRHLFFKVGTCNFVIKNVQRDRITYVSIVYSSSVSEPWSITSSSEAIKLLHWKRMPSWFL